MAVYLIHFHRPISGSSSAQHYIGYANNVEARIHYHRLGRSGVRLFEIAKERGIGFDVVRVWDDGDRAFERKLKNYKNSPKRLCPVCRRENHDDR